MIFRRGQTYWYKFSWTVKQADGPSQSFLIRRSARTKVPAEAEEVEHEHRRALRLGEIHPLDAWPRPRPPEAPLLKDFVDRFLQYSQLQVKESTFGFYSKCISRLLGFPDLANAQISKINPELVTKYALNRKTLDVGVNAINGEIRTLRRLLRLAFEWELIPRTAVVHELSGERIRRQVVSFPDEQKYLDAASANLRALTILAADTGMRPSELFRLIWSQVRLESADLLPWGCIDLRDGKTKSSDRVVPLTPRAREELFVLKADLARKRWIFPGPGNSGHLVSIQNSHRRAIRKAGLALFPFYCWRHTFGTRCAESGMDRHTLANLMGHSSPRITEKYYIHVTEPHITSEFERFMTYQARHLAANPPAASVQ
ncbi:MAG: tyrosine-type recombinase/integrase [Candidatus Angelobacter sp.]